MKKRTAIIVIIVVFLVLCLIPSSSSIKAADGEKRIYQPLLLPIYRVVECNKIEFNPYPRKTTKGIQVFIFGICVYDGHYTVEGMHRRGS